MEIKGSVGKAGKNNPSDVRVVQALLQQNASSLGPVSVLSPTGICDAQTVFQIEVFQRNEMSMAIATGLVEPNSRTLFALNGASGPSTAADRILQDALDALRTESINFGWRFIQDAGVRAQYLAKAEEVSAEILAKVQRGEYTSTMGAEEAHAMRNGLLDSGRLKSSDIGKAVAEAEKANGTEMEVLLSKYAKKLFNKEFSGLGTAEQDAVFIQIVKASGRPNPRYTALASKLGDAGKGLLIISIALSVYSIAESDRPGREAVKQGTGLGVSFLGSLAGGAVAGLACGPGAPICVGVGVFVGGLVFALGSDFAIDEIWE